MYTLQHTLQSIAQQQSRINVQKAALEEEERLLKRRRQATLRRVREQRLREVMGEPEIDDIVMRIAERDQYRRMDDREIADAVMEILKQNDPRSMARGWTPAAKGLQVRELLDPSPRVPQLVMPEPHTATPVFHIPTYHEHQSTSSPVPLYVETPVVNELPPQRRSDAPSPEYFLEPSLKNKRGSRRQSTRRDSQSAEDPSIPQSTTRITASLTLTSYSLLRTKLQNELSSIPTSIRSDVKPTPDQRKLLHHHMAKLEDILYEVDAVPTPSENEDEALQTRKVRREVVAEIVNAIDAIERFTTPDTPVETEAVGTTGEEARDAEREGTEGGLSDEEIQRVIRETLARKKDEDTASVSRRSVTIEDVPDAEY